MRFIYSHGGYAREYMRCAQKQFSDEEIYFVDDNPGGDAITYEKACSMDVNRSAKWNIGFADCKIRRMKTDQVQKDGFELFSVAAPTSVVGNSVSIGEGAVLSDFSILTADLQIGKSFHCNIYSYVAHDCEVGDFVTLAPRVSVNGRVTIEDDVYIGTGATILPGRSDQPIRIGKGAIVGAHALVTKDVEPGATVVGAPAKPLNPRN